MDENEAVEPVEIDMSDIEAVSGEFIKFDMNWCMIPPGLGYETSALSPGDDNGH